MGERSESGAKAHAARRGFLLRRDHLRDAGGVYRIMWTDAFRDADAWRTPITLAIPPRAALEHAAQLGRGGDVARPQCQPHGIQLFRIVQREIGRPAGFVLDQINRNFNRILAFAAELGDASFHGLRFRGLGPSETGAPGTVFCERAAMKASNHARN